MQGDPEAFSYSPLHRQHKQIRLVRVDRRNRDANAIHLLLRAHDTDALIRPSYFAVSYTWGSEYPLREIYVNGKKFLVRENLFALLRQLKAHPTILRQWFWIDQICIDQSNLSERNDVVERMSDIYTSAKEVVIWLGKSSRDLDFILDILSGKNKAKYWYDVDSDQLRRSRAAFFGLDYWSRLWIVQEMLLARRVSYWCGQKVVNQKHMNRNSKRFIMREGRRDYDIPWILIDKASNGAQDLSWRLLLVRFGSQKCTNPLDHVYGLQGLRDPHFRVAVDYSTSQAQLVMNVLLKGVEEWFMRHQNEKLNPLNVNRENFDTSIELMDVLFGDAYQLGALIVLQAVVWSACLFQYRSRVTGPEDEWSSFWTFLSEARTPGHRALAESIRDNLVRYEIAARNWTSWDHLNELRQGKIKYADYKGQATRAVKEAIATASRECNYESAEGYFVHKEDVNYAELLDATTKDGTASARLIDNPTSDFIETLKMPRSDDSKKDFFAVPFLNTQSWSSLSQWTIYGDLSARGL